MLVRALIVLLVVLNLGAATWWIAHDPPPPSAPVQVPPGVARLRLVEETTGVPASPPATMASATPAPAPATPAAADIAASPPPQCFSFGPFASKPAGSAAAAKLTPLVQKLTAREQPVASPERGWRVYLPPLPSAEQAQAAAQRIGAAGFSDFLVVREGAEANSIALGRYRSEDAAKKRAEALNAAGFPAQARVLGEPAGVAIWLDVVVDAAFDPRRAQAAIAAAQYRKADCAAQR
jgi:hypothetical protein